MEDSNVKAYTINRKGKTEKNKKIKAGPCIFPFKYKGKIYNECLDTPKGKLCATEINPKNGILTKYGYCQGLGVPPLRPRSASPRGSAASKASPTTPSKPRSPPRVKKSTVKKTLKIKKKKVSIKAKTPSPVKAKVKTPSPKKSPIKTTIKKKKLIIKKRIKPITEVKETVMPMQPTMQPTMQPSLQPPPHSLPLKGGPGLAEPAGLAPHFIKVLEELADISQRQGEPFKARAYQKAQESIMLYEGDIQTLDQIKDLPGIGKTILSKLDEYIKTGTLQILERERNNPINVLTKVYGIGPKKAEELVKEGINTIADLRAHPEKLNDVQKVGLKYFEAIETRIPRSEIDDYKKVFETIFQQTIPAGSKMEIVGSYRRGALNSGDIDMILGVPPPHDGVAAFRTFLDRLIKDKIVIEVLSRGKAKSLTIAQLPGMLPRRVDFLYASPSEYAFALLYFTGSKTFNTVQRAKALKMGYTLNEHGLYHMTNKVKGEKVKGDFPNEKSIFDKLEMAYKEPWERVDGRSVNPRSDATSKASPTTPPIQEAPIQKAPKLLPIIPLVPAPKGSPGLALPVGKPPRKTLKIKKPKTNIQMILNPSTIPAAIEGPPPPPPIEDLPMLLDFKSRGVAALNNLDEEDLSALIRAANTAYYCNQTPIMTDNEYDILREHILERFPGNLAAQEGHTQCIISDEKSKVKLPYEMWSMDKIKPDTQALIKWQEIYKGPYILSCKLDGISGLYSTEGPKPKLYTRGNGTVGQDISKFLPYLNLPREKGITLRGEFIIRKDTFALKYAKEFANSRNFMAGVINSKTPDPIKCADIDFVTYEVLNPSIKPSDQMQYLLKLLEGTEEVKETKKKKSAFQVVQHFVSPTISNELLSELLVKWRAEYAYDIDGIICINDAIYPRQTGNPAHAFAFKMVLSDQVAEAKVLDVIWTPSKDGLLKPRVHIEAIQLGGVKIEYATGFNARFIEDNKIGIGALIRLTRSGDVIPHIIAVAQPAAQAQMPTIPYEWNETHVDIMLLNKADDATVKEKNITLFFSSLDVEGLGAGNVKKIIAAGFDTVIKILKMTEADFLQVQGFKQKMATKVRESIREKVEKASLPELMHATNIFGRGFGVKKFNLILSKEPDILTDDINEEKVKQITALEGLARKTAEQFVKQIPLFLAFLKEADLMNKLQQEKEHIKKAEELEKQKDVTHPLYGKQFIMTGFRDKELLEKLLIIGAEQGSAVRKGTFVLLVKDVSEENSKTKEAKTLGIPIMTPSEFKTKYNL